MMKAIPHCRNTLFMSLILFLFQVNCVSAAASKPVCIAQPHSAEKRNEFTLKNAMFNTAQKAIQALFTVKRLINKAIVGIKKMMEGGAGWKLLGTLAIVGGVVAFVLIGLGSGLYVASLWHWPMLIIYVLAILLTIGLWSI